MAAKDFAHHFSEKNIPFGIASSSRHQSPQAATRLENTVVFLHDLQTQGFFKDLPDGLFNQATLNSFAALDKSAHLAVRRTIQDKLHQNGLDGLPAESKEDITLVTMHLPVEIRDFAGTRFSPISQSLFANPPDFSCSLDHVTNAGRIIVGSDKPPPAFFKFPIGYQGRTSSIVISGTDIERPMGQFRDLSVQDSLSEKAIAFGPSNKVDYEVELAAIIGKPLAMKKRLQAKDSNDHIFGFVILNDWSARDIQGFEMNPLGPFNGKSLGTSISPWIITLDALDSFKTDAPHQTSVAAHLSQSASSTYSITMEVEILAGSSATTVGVCPVESLYWTPSQMIAHSVSSGSALRTGDILATGTRGVKNQSR
ncbi:hypothetical protein FZEAL_3886 [Fusarium zealandicum]|uniref:Fumarylacetoacetase n=1 Tax=Fusarium zealandicum TaxID=1053134 RepID=A0A8H4UNC2_9HYPO|nr:hypothetical protein FZEAL_3886 [Fusarium zealandicum]